MVGEAPLYPATVSRGVTPKHGGEGSAERWVDFSRPLPTGCVHATPVQINQWESQPQSGLRRRSRAICKCL